jgi:AraC-like DNA-binding protein
VTGARLSTIVLDLLTTALTESLGHGGSRAPTAPESLRFQVHAFIEEHLQDRGLTIASIAAANHISVRTLHRLFVAEETTVAGWIRRRRLERCRKDLVDPTLRHLAVSTIAARWGMPESAHFSRLFRREYGVPPTEYRTFCLSSGTGGQAHGTHDHDAASARGGS